MTKRRMASSPEIVNEILAYAPENYLMQDELERYTDVFSTFSEEARQARAIQRDDSTLVGAVLQEALEKLQQLEIEAHGRFAKMYRKYDAELTEAFEIQAAYTIVQSREFVLEFGQQNDQDLEAVRKICESLTLGKPIPTLSDSKNVIFASFTDPKLKIAIQNDTAHIREALRLGQPNIVDQLDMRTNDLLAQKWALPMPGMQPHSRSIVINNRGDVTLLGSAALADLHAATPKAAKKDLVYGQRTFEYRAVKAIFEGDAPPLGPASYKILNYWIALLYRQNPGTRRLRLDHQPNTIVRVHTKDIMEMFGWTNRQSAQRRIREAFATCEHMRIETEGFFYGIDTNGKMKKMPYGTGSPLIISSHRVFHGGYEIFFDTQFVQYLLGSYAVDVPPLYFSVGSNASAIIYKMAMHSQMNAGKSNENLIGISTLIEVCPEIAVTDRHTIRLIERLDLSLREIQGQDIRLEYRDPGGKQITISELKNLSREKFLNCKVWFEFVRRDEDYFTILGNGPAGSDEASQTLLAEPKTEDDQKQD